MRKLMDAIDIHNKGLYGNLERQSIKDMGGSDDYEENMEFISAEYRYLDWRADVDDTLQEVATEIDRHGLKLQIIDTGSDDIFFRIMKKGI